MKNSLYIIGSAGVPSRYGGFETFAHQLAINLADEFNVHIACSSKFYEPGERQVAFYKTNRFFIPFSPNGFSGLLYDLKALSIAYQNTTPNDYILILGSGPGLLLPFLPRLKNRKLIIHLDGLEWQRAKWNCVVKLILRLSWKLSLRYGTKLIIDNKQLLHPIPEFFRAKTSICTYGSDHLPANNLVSLSFIKPFSLVIARAEPENNLSIILKTFASNPDLKLIIISNAMNTKFGKRLIKKYSICSNIEFIAAIYDNPVLLQSYRMNCSTYIHGHSVGGTNPSLIEAMASGVAIIAWDNIFNRETTNNEALYFRDSQSLIEHLNNYQAEPNDTIGMKLKTLAKTNYQWKLVVSELTVAMRK